LSGGSAVGITLQIPERARYLPRLRNVRTRPVV